MKMIKRKTTLAMGLMFILVCSSGGSFAAPLIVGPYIQQSQSSSVIVSWMTIPSTKRDEVHWGTSPALDNITVENHILAHTFHSIKINELAPGRQYHYSVVSDGTESPSYRFCTAFPSNEAIRFVIYGDSRGGWDNWQSALQVAQAIEQDTPMFVLHTGDLVDNGRKPCDWVDFFSASPFTHNSTFYPVLGNHEQSSALYFYYFSLPFIECWYSFDNGPVHFIGLNSNPRYAYRFTQYFWLLWDLWTHDKPFTIVFFHHPLYSSGNHGNTTLLQKIWAPVFEHSDVDIVFNGHEHSYERSYVNNVTYIVTGGGGAPLYNVGHSPWTIYSEKTYHYCLIMVDSSVLTFQAKKPDGFTFDLFTLTK